MISLYCSLHNVTPIPYLRFWLFPSEVSQRKSQENHRYRVNRCQAFLLVTLSWKFLLLTLILQYYFFRSLNPSLSLSLLYTKYRFSFLFRFPTNLSFFFSISLYFSQSLSFSLLRYFLFFLYTFVPSLSIYMFFLLSTFPIISIFKLNFTREDFSLSYPTLVCLSFIVWCQVLFLALFSLIYFFSLSPSSYFSLFFFVVNFTLFCYTYPHKRVLLL